jgi:hypothetical protein
MKDGEATLAFVVKYLSSDLPIGEPPKLDRDDG